MTAEQIAILIASTGYAALFFFGVLSLLGMMFALFDTGVNRLYFGDKNLAWLELLLIPVVGCICLLYFRTVIPYILL